VGWRFPPCHIDVCFCNIHKAKAILCRVYRSKWQRQFFPSLVFPLFFLPILSYCFSLHLLTVASLSDIKFPTHSFSPCSQRHNPPPATVDPARPFPAVVGMPPCLRVNLTSTGFVRVRLHPRGGGACKAKISTAGECVWLGTLNTKEEATHTYNTASWRFRRSLCQLPG
jgi:hypothetical protein